jgi:hypothetical protein
VTRQLRNAAPATARPETTEERVETEGRWHVAHRVTTRCGKLAKAGRLAKHLHAAAEYHGMQLAQAHGAAVNDRDQSTSRLISNYDGMPVDPNAYRSRTPTDAQIDARTFTAYISQRCPAEFLETFNDITKEEADLLTGKPSTLKQIGMRFGFKSDKQKTAGAQIHVIDVLAWLNWAQEDFLQRFPPSRDGSRKSLHLRIKAAERK